jgi:uncharacterized protein (TIGR03435 family)
MKPDQNSIDEMIERHLPSAPPHHVEAAGIRVWQRLSNANPSAATPLEARLHASGWTAGRSAPRTIVSYAAVAALIVLAVGLAIVWPSAGVAVLEAADSSVYRVANGTTERLAPGQAIGRGEGVRADGGAVLRLADGSHVEMRSMSELSFERGDDGLGIRLQNGSIIVSAAMREAERLYVKTKDMTASVAGTVALVNAENNGSRVGVIKGEVQVREGTVETRLRPGEQVATNRTAPPRPLSEEVGWSRQADPLRAILATFQKGMEISAGPMTKVAVPAAAQQATGAAPASRAADATQEFEEASVRPCDPDNIPEPPAGARGGGANSFQMTPGRTHALCMTVATLIRTAYGYAPAFAFTNNGRARGFNYNNVYGLGVEDGRRVRGGPDWVLSERYTIDAVAADASDAATMSGSMLRALLEKRFHLQAHVETEQIPAFDLIIAPGGLKMKEGTCTPDPSAPPPRSTNDVVRKNLDAARRGATTAAPCGLALAANGPNILEVSAGAGVPPFNGVLGVPVTDRTGIPTTARFNYVLEFSPDDTTSGPLGRILPGPPNGPDVQISSDPGAVPRAPNIFTAIEEQLGLKLVPSRAPQEFILIDHVERPAAN